MKKVLIVAYYWPPSAGPGVQRWLKFVKYLRRFGVEPVLYVPENSGYPVQDASLIKDIPEGIRVYRGKISDPNAWLGRIRKKGKPTAAAGFLSDKKKKGLLFRFLVWIRANFFIPDARMWWIGPSVRRIKKILKEEKIDTVITTGPPHSCHVIGLRLKRKTGVRWIADFRDPWIKIDYFHHLPLTACARRKHEKLETAVLAEADDVITVTPSVYADFAPKVKGRIHMITNGYDTDDLPEQEVPLSEKFSIGHIGSMNADRNPSELWEVLGELCREIGGFRDDLEIVQAGLAGEEVREQLAENGLENNFVYYAYLPHDRVIRLQRELQLLLLVMYRTPDGNMIIVGKLFEYLASGRPVLALGFPESDTARILEKTEAGTVFAFPDKKGLKEYIAEAYRRYKTGSLGSSARDIGEYSREQLTARLVNEVLEAN